MRHFHLWTTLTAQAHSSCLNDLKLSAKSNIETIIIKVVSTTLTLALLDAEKMSAASMSIGSVLRTTMMYLYRILLCLIERLDHSDRAFRKSSKAQIKLLLWQRVTYIVSLIGRPCLREWVSKFSDAC